MQAPLNGAQAGDGQPHEGARVSVGTMTAPAQVEHADLRRVWLEADAVPEIEHAWLYDHLMPIFGDPDGPTFEGWTLVSALTGQPTGSVSGCR